MVDPGRVRDFLDRLGEEVGQHVVASESLRAPSDFADVFAALGEADYVPAELVPLLQEMARFRNLLVHGYRRVDDRRVTEILGSRLGDFEQFRAAIARALIE